MENLFNYFISSLLETLKVNFTHCSANIYQLINEIKKSQSGHKNNYNNFMYDFRNSYFCNIYVT